MMKCFEDDETPAGQTTRRRKKKKREKKEDRKKNGGKACEREIASLILFVTYKILHFDVLIDPAVGI